MKKIIIALLIGLVGSLVLSSYSAFAQECNQIRSSVLRLHILANSDDQADQQLKLSVRDEILKNSDGIFEYSNDKQTAKLQAIQKADQIKQIALKEIEKQGYNYSVDVEICNMFFDTRTYDTVTLPAGNYDAVRVTIGEAKGKNWWCVLYPPMCLPAAQPKAEIEDVLSEEQSQIVEKPQEYEIRFATVEIFETIKNKLFD